MGPSPQGQGDCGRDIASAQCAERCLGCPESGCPVGDTREATGRVPGARSWTMGGRTVPEGPERVSEPSDTIEGPRLQRMSLQRRPRGGSQKGQLGEGRALAAKEREFGRERVAGSEVLQDGHSRGQRREMERRSRERGCS